MAAEASLVKSEFRYFSEEDGILLNTDPNADTAKWQNRMGIRKSKRITNRDAQSKVAMAVNQAIATGKLSDIHKDSFLKL